MARQNNTVVPPKANRNETNGDDTNRESRRSSIFIDGDENEERRMVTLEEFLQFVTEKPEWLYGKLCLIHQRYEECLDQHEVHLAEEELHGKAKDGEIALLHREMEKMKERLQNQTDNNDNEDVNELHQQISDVKRQLAEVKAERDAFGNQIARLMMDGVSGHQACSIPTHVLKSTKIPDPPMLNDGKEPRFEDWLLSMTWKLTANADHFDTSQLRMAYVASRCEGKAQKHITPRLRDDAMNPYTDSKDMLDHLKTIYNDPNLVTTVKHQFRQLYMKVSDKFHDFLSEFLYLAAEADVAEKDWKDKLYHKLTTELQKLCISDSFKDGTFQEFSNAVSQTASRLEVINHRKQRNRSFAPSNQGSAKKGMSQSRTAVKKEPTPSRSTSPLYKQTAEELEAARDYIVDNRNKGFIGFSAAPFSSHILMARKPGGGLRFCVDYRKLNAITQKDRYPIPPVDELMERISGAKIFTKLNIRQAFHRIRPDPKSEDLTTFRTRYGTYKHRVVPFGLNNGLAAFQRFTNDTLMDYLDEFVTAFVGDLLIYSKDVVEHELHVKKVLERLRAAGLQASIDQCEFHVTRTKYLGFTLTIDGIEVDPEKTAVICNWDVPTTIRDVQSFLGFCNFYRRFIKDYSRVAKPLNHLTRKDVPFTWTRQHQEAFEELKRQLADAPILRHYNPDLETKLETDASDGVVAEVLSQKHGDLWHPIA